MFFPVLKDLTWNYYQDQSISETPFIWYPIQDLNLCVPVFDSYSLNPYLAFSNPTICPTKSPNSGRSLEEGM